jgi:hypothetical protein
MPIRTVIVAATVVEAFIRIEDHASEKRRRTRLIPTPGAGKAGASAL